MSIAGGDSDNFKISYRMITPEGDSRWISSRGKSLYNLPDGRPVLFTGSDIDITDLKTAEIKLIHSIEQEKQRREELEQIREIISE